MKLELICSLTLVIVTVYLVRLIQILPFFKDCDRNSQPYQANPLWSNTSKAKNASKKIFVFLGSGGHTGEMMRLLENYKNFFLADKSILYVGYSDPISLERFKRLAASHDLNVTYYHFVKAREVGANKIASIKSIIKTLIDSFKHVYEIRSQMQGSPHIVLLNGPGTCCILGLWFKLFEWLFLFSASSNITYVESLARINSLSLSGKILYWMADEFIVQWEDLKVQAAPRSKYFGILV